MISDPVAYLLADVPGRVVPDHEERRDALSNQLIELVAPRSHRLIIRRDSDEDGLFARIAKAGHIPLVVIENVLDLKQPLAELLAGE